MLPRMALCWEWHESGARVKTLEAELEVQRTIKRAELTAFLCLLGKAIVPTMVYVDQEREFAAVKEHSQERSCQKTTDRLPAQQRGGLE